MTALNNLFRKSTNSLVLALQLAIPASSMAAITGGPDLAHFSICYEDTIHNSGTKLTIRNGMESTKVSYDGKIQLTDDERDIKSITPGGYFKVSKTTFGNSRTIRIDSESGGRLKRTYTVGNKEVPFEPEGRQYLADVLPELLRTTLISADERVARIYAKSGSRGVLDVVSAMESDYVKAGYLNYLLKQPGLKDADYSAILGVAGAFSSDYEKGKLLQGMSKVAGNNQKVMADFLKAASGMSSDYERSKVLQTVVGRSNLSNENFQQAMTATGQMNSDYEKGKVMSQAINNKTLADQHLLQLLEVVKNISSDYEKSKLLQQLVNSHKLAGTAFSRAFAVTGTLDSDYEKGKVISQISQHEALTPALYLQLFETVKTMGSDYEKGKALKAIAQKMPRNNSQVMDAYRKTAKTIESQHEYGGVMRAVE